MGAIPCHPLQIPIVAICNCLTYKTLASNNVGQPIGAPRFARQLAKTIIRRSNPRLTVHESEAPS